MTAAGQTPATDSERLEQIRARVQASTEGPWEAAHRTDLDWLSRSGSTDSTGHQPGSSIRPVDAVDPLWGSVWPNRNAPADAEFIAHARDDVPWLLARLAEQAALTPAPQPAAATEHHEKATATALCACGAAPDGYALPTDAAQWRTWDQWLREHIAAARQDAPWLLAEVTRLTALLAEQAATIERVQAVHVRRAWDYDRDPVTRFKHQKFLDQCDHCRVNWPCRTARALGSQRTEGQG